VPWRYRRQPEDVCLPGYPPWLAAPTRSRNQVMRDMNLYRKAFAKHYCPSCGARVRRIREPLLEAVLREIVLFLPIVFGALLLGSVVAKLGFASGYEALAFGCILVGLAIYPFLEQLSRYRCTACGKESSFREVVSRGWSLA